MELENERNKDKQRAQRGVESQYWREGTSPAARAKADALAYIDGDGTREGDLDKLVKQQAQRKQEALHTLRAPKDGDADRLQE